ncbi:MAG: hypothetical protein FWC55_03690, partial [Firmicutes bacterium]|nr:hypothetical protein [Bacillota bacterium]
YAGTPTQEGNERLNSPPLEGWREAPGWFLFAAKSPFAAGGGSKAPAPQSPFHWKSLAGKILLTLKDIINLFTRRDLLIILCIT